MQHLRKTTIMNNQQMKKRRHDDADDDYGRGTAAAVMNTNDGPKEAKSDDIVYELVTSQYINGFKMVTLASLSSSNNNIAIHSINPIKTQNNTSVIKANFTLPLHQDADPSTIHQDDSSATDHLEYYSNILPSSLTSFQCDSQYKDVFDFVVLKMNQQNIQAFPSNTTDNKRVGELRVNVEPLKPYLTCGW